MDDGGWSVVVEDPAQSGFIQKVALDEGEGFAGDLPDPVQGLFFAVAEVVDGNDFVAGLQKFNTGVGADISSAAGYEDGGGHCQRSMDTGSIPGWFSEILDGAG